MGMLAEIRVRNMTWRVEDREVLTNRAKAKEWEGGRMKGMVATWMKRGLVGILDACK